VTIPTMFVGRYPGRAQTTGQYPPVSAGTDQTRIQTPGTARTDTPPTGFRKPARTGGRLATIGQRGVRRDPIERHRIESSSPWIRPSPPPEERANTGQRMAEADRMTDSLPGKPPGTRHEVTPSVQRARRLGLFSDSHWSALEPIGLSDIGGVGAQLHRSELMPPAVWGDAPGFARGVEASRVYSALGSFTLPPAVLASLIGSDGGRLGQNLGRNRNESSNDPDRSSNQVRRRRLDPRRGRDDSYDQEAPSPEEWSEADREAAMPFARHAIARAAINRQTSNSSASSGGSATSAGGTSATSGSSESGGSNLDLVARQVYSILRQRLAVERERIGGGPGARTW
jgi:hypothetical protein